jgi:hypothetical protein
MILQHLEGSLLVVRQPDHGLQTGDFASHWGNEHMPPVTPREPVIEAGTRHDNGWKEWEDKPSLDPSTGQPWQFLRLSPHEHVPLYRRGIQQAAELDPYTGLLVSMHGAGLYNDRYGTFRLAEQRFSPEERAIVDEFLAEQALFQQALSERALRREVHTHVTTDPEVWFNYRLLQVWDRLSLQYAFRLATEGDIGPLPRRDGPDQVLHCVPRGQFSLGLDPYPFDDAELVFPLKVRRIPDRAYRNPEDFLEAMTRAPETVLECRAAAA